MGTPALGSYLDACSSLKWKTRLRSFNAIYQLVNTTYSREEHLSAKEFKQVIRGYLLHLNDDRDEIVEIVQESLQMLFEVSDEEMTRYISDLLPKILANLATRKSNLLKRGATNLLALITEEQTPDVLTSSLLEMLVGKQKNLKVTLLVLELLNKKIESCEEFFLEDANVKYAIDAICKVLTK